MPGSGCSALHGVNPNFFKKKEQQQNHSTKVDGTARIATWNRQYLQPFLSVTSYNFVSWLSPILNLDLPCQVLTLTFSSRNWNTVLVSSRARLTPWGEGASLVLVACPFNDGVTMKIPYRVMFYYIDQPCTPSFPIVLVKTVWIVRSVTTDLGRSTLVVAVINVDASPFLA